MTAELTNMQRWWERLPEDFYRRGDCTDLDSRHPIQVRASAALDRGLRSGMATLMCSAMAPALWPHRQAERERRLLRVYQNYANRADAAAAFPAPMGAPRVRRSRPHQLFVPRDVNAELLHFDSRFEPLCSELAERYGGHRRNRTAHAQYWSHANGPRPTLIFLHGYFLSQYALNSWAFSLPWFYKHGYDILLYTLPFHGARRDWRRVVNGQGFFAEGFAHLNEAMRQAVHDVRLLINFLEAGGAPSVGVSGLSLGGYLSALLACVEPRLAFSIPNSPVVAPIDMALCWQPSGLCLRWLMQRHGITLPELRHGLALHSPLTYAPVLDADRRLLIGGAGDRITPPRLFRLLEAHWPGSHVHWFPGNHVMHFQQAEYLKLMKAFMDRHTGAGMS